MQDGKKTTPVCTVFAQNPRNPLRNRWVYGAAPDGYQKRGCAPLTPGTYHIAVVGGGGGSLAFRIRENGALDVVPE